MAIAQERHPMRRHQPELFLPPSEGVLPTFELEADDISEAWWVGETMARQLPEVVRETWETSARARTVSR